MVRFTLLISFFMLNTLSAFADDLDVDLSRPDVRLDVSFKGSDLLLFGAKDLFGDIIIVVRGPTKNTSVRLKERIMGVWASTDEVVFAKTPSYYALASTQTITDLLPLSVLKTEQIGTKNLGLEFKKKPEGATQKTLQDFTDGLIRNMTKKNLYSTSVGQIGLIGKQLFRTNLWFPSNVSVGEYVIDTYLIVNNQIENKRTTYLDVHKVGLEAQIYNLAHEYALIYGILAILIAIISGWTANVVFRKKG